MKISYSWLKDYVDVKLDPRKLAHILTMAGVNVTSCESVGGDDYIFEFEITANRPDCLSVLGIAREAAAILGKKLKVPKELGVSPSLFAGKQKAFSNIILKDPDLCPRYTARSIKNVEVRTSPDWLKEKIISVGLRPVNNIVDITNFVLFETGQPMHAFDMDKLRGAITVRRASRGEKLLTIDNVHRTLTEEMLVIADETGPVAIAGVMGGLNTEVSKITKNILLESAFFHPVSVRRTSRALGLSSESSYRFERKIDNGMIRRASKRAGSLIEIIASGEPGTFLDVGKKTVYSKTINFDMEKSNKILGVSIKKSEAAKILKALGFSAANKKGSMKVTIPSFREDVKTDIDLIEEVARVYGYEKIPTTLPHIIGNSKVKEAVTVLQEKISDILIKLGLNEIMTYALLGKNSIKDFGIPEEDLLVLKNPLSIDQEIMRPTMLAGALKVISYNINRKAKRLSLFEVGKIYKEKKGSYNEEPILSLVLAGTKREDWRMPAEEFSFFDLKGVFEKLLSELGLEKTCFKNGEVTGCNKDISSVVEHNGEVIASLGEIDRKINDKFDIEKKVFYGELYIERLFNKVKLTAEYNGISRYPSIMRDISIVLDEGLTSAEVTDVIKETGKELIKRVTLIDCYSGKQIPEGKRGLLYRIEYQSSEKTLEDAEVDHLHAEIKSTLSQKLRISFR